MWSAVLVTVVGSTATWKIGKECLSLTTVTCALQILPVAVRNLLDKNVRMAIMKICRVFQKLCEKEIRQDDEVALMNDVVTRGGHSHYIWVTHVRR